MSGMSRNTVGHSGKCTVCQLCLKSNAKIKHLNQMNVQPQFKEAYTWLKEHQPTINDSACICLPCVKQIQRNHSKEFTPRWLPKPPVPLKLCNLEHCKCIVYAQTTLVTVDELEKCLKQKVNAFTVTSDQSNSIGLCRQHYMLMYNTLHAAPCDSCLAKPKKGETFNRHCSSCKKKDRKCGPSCSCHFCKNTINPQKETCTSETDLLVQDLLEEHSDDTYVEESDDDLEDLRNEEMDNDQELQELMDYVFGPETDDEDYS